MYKKHTAYHKTDALLADSPLIQMAILLESCSRMILKLQKNLLNQEFEAGHRQMEKVTLLLEGIQGNLATESSVEACHLYFYLQDIIQRLFKLHCKNQPEECDHLVFLLTEMAAVWRTAHQQQKKPVGAHPPSLQEQQEAIRT